MISHANNETACRILDSHDLISNPKLDAFLHMVSQRPLWERLKLLNSKSPSKAYSRFLYKYRPLSFDSVDQANRLREYLVESKLWLSSPASFNDPFDMRGRHTFDGTPRAKRKLIISKLQKYRPELTNKQREVEASNLLVNGTLMNSLDNIHNQQRGKLGVCSFAGNPRNILMWSHYGSNHTGVCLQFQLAQDLFIFSRAIHVEYSTEYPLVDYLEEEYQKSIIPTLFRKAKDWEYEQERRIVHPYGANCHLTFKPSALTALVLGCEIGATSEEILKTLLIERQQKGYPPVTVFRAFRHNTQYKLRLLRQQNWPGST